MKLYHHYLEIIKITENPKHLRYKQKQCILNKLAIYKIKISTICSAKIGGGGGGHEGKCTKEMQELKPNLKTNPMDINSPRQYQYPGEEKLKATKTRGLAREASLSGRASGYGLPLQNASGESWLQGLLLACLLVSVYSFCALPFPSVKWP